MLSEILQEKRKWIDRVKKEISQEKLQEQIKKLAFPLSLSKSLRQGKRMHLIAEIKKTSPSAGILRENFDPVEIAKTYQNSGADAISVLTDERFFMGSLEHIRQVKSHVRLPVLRKDFILDSYQIYETRAAGADAILLIADLLPLERLSDFLSLTYSLGMEALVEIHTLEDLKKSMQTQVEIIGINQRNLHTFQINKEVTHQSIPLIPNGKIVVCESGINSHAEIMQLEKLGIHAVLIGETFMRSPDISQTMKELFH